MSEQWFKRKIDAERYAKSLRDNYNHVSITQSHASYVVVYCCPKNEKLAALLAKCGVARCQMQARNPHTVIPSKFTTAKVRQVRGQIQILLP